MKKTTDESTLRPIAVVTGASSGIGYELAKVFAKNNFDLLVIAEDAGIAEAGNTFRQMGREVTTLQAALTTFEGVEKAYQGIKALGRPIDSIAINAGVGVGGKFTESNLEDELNLISLNIISVVHLAKRVLMDMENVGHGRVLFTSSFAAEMPGPYYAVHAASKSFVQSFAEAVRNELQDSGITITALQPGATATHFFHGAHMEDTKAGVAKKDDPAMVAEDGFRALMAGSDHVIAGSFKNKVQATVAKFLSEKQASNLHGKQTTPISGV